MRRITFSIVGLGSRGLDAYAPFQKAHPELMKIVAVADVRPEKVEKARKEYGVDPSLCFDSADALLSCDRLSDAIIIATQDQDHVSQALKAIDKGYDILLEKPISPSREECLELSAKAREKGTFITVCHVLRYTPFYRTLKRLMDEGRIGRLMNIDAVEGVGYFHMAHSFVRGNWRTVRTTSPMILQKSCHDMDIIRYLVGSPCHSVSSQGTLSWFSSANAPEGSAMRCLDGCACKDTCPFDCEKIYITDKRSGILHHPEPTWPVDVLTDDYSVDGVMKALRNGPYGRCVFHCDNDVVDHQSVTLSFENGVTASFTMTAFSKENHRTIRLFGTEGEIFADMRENVIHLKRFDNDDGDITVEKPSSGHGGGDYQIMMDFIQTLNGVGSVSSTLDASIESHLMCFAAEDSRKADKTVIIDR